MNPVDSNNNSASETEAQTAEASQAESSIATVLEEFLPCEYDMTHKHRGVALIFNHEFYLNGKRKRRTGTNFDRDRLEKVLTSLYFDVHVHNDLRLKLIKKELQRGKKFTI